MSGTLLVLTNARRARETASRRAAEARAEREARVRAMQAGSLPARGSLLALGETVEDCVAAAAARASPRGRLDASSLREAAFDPAERQWARWFRLEGEALGHTVSGVVLDGRAAALDLVADRLPPPWEGNPAVARVARAGVVAGFSMLALLGLAGLLSVFG